MLNRNGQKTRLGSAPPRAQGSSQGYVRRLQAPIGRGDRTASGARHAAEGEGAEPLFLKQQDYKFHSIHENQFHDAELLVNPEVLNSVREGDLMGLWNTPTPKETPENQPPPKERMVVLKVTLKGLAGLSPFSLRRSVRDTFDLSADRITMCQVRPEEVQADHVELTIKGMFVPRADLYRFLNAINGETAYGGKMFNLPGMMRARVNVVNRNKKPVNAGVISKRTHVSCRSRSSRIFWLVQLSTEMYDVNQQGECYYEVFLRFMEHALDRWKELDVTHHLTVVFFCRTHFCSNKKSEPISPKEGLYARPILTAPDGRLYEDTYKVVVHNETRAQLGGDKMRLVWRLYDEFMQFPVTMGWYKKVDLNASIPAARNGGRSRASTAGVPEAESPDLDLRDPGVRLRIPCNAASGNVLEAINVTLNVLQKHYVDRDLTRSGNSVVMISAGTGVFNVDGGLSATTTQRMMDNGIGMDMVSLSQPPLHTAPLFISKRLVPVDAAPANPLEAASAAAAKAKQHEQQQQQQHVPQQGADSPVSARRDPSLNSEEAFIQEHPKYEVPHFMNLTFAAAAKPRKLRDVSKFDAPKAPPRGLSSTPPEHPRATCIDKPVSMPKLVWPRPFSRKSDGSIDIDTLCIPRILGVIVGHEKTGAIDITDDRDPETPWVSGNTEEATPASKAEEGLEQTNPFALKRWHTAEEMYPQPPPGMEGAAEFARRLADSRALSPAPAPAADAAIPPLTPHGRRTKSPTGSSTSLAGRHTSDLLGTSPGTGYIGSPRSVGRSTLSQLARPWPDKDSYVGVSAQPTLRGSPRGYPAGGKVWGFAGSSGGSGSGGSCGSGGGSTPVAPAAIDTSNSAGKGAADGMSYPEFERKKMTDEVWRLMEPKYDKYDEQVDQPVMEAPRPPRASNRAVKMGDWGSRPAETPSPFSRPPSVGPTTGGNKAQHPTSEDTPTYSSEPATHMASMGKRSSFTVSDIGGASTDGSSAASSPVPQEFTDRSTTAGGAPSSSRERGGSSTFSQSTAAPAPRRWVWSKKQETAQPATSPGNSLWPLSKDPLPKLNAKHAAKSNRGGGGGGGRTDGTSKSIAGDRSPANTAHQGAPTPLWTPQLSLDNPAPSPAGPYAESGEAPPMLALGKSPAKSFLKLQSDHSPVAAPPPSATSAGRGLQQPRGRGWGAKTPLAGGTQGAKIASAATVPVKIERACSDSRKSDAGRKGGKFVQRSSPRAVPKGDTVRADVGGRGYGYGHGRSPVGRAWPRPSSSLETPGVLSSLKGDKLDAPLRRPRFPVPNPQSQESAEVIGALVEQSQTPTCPSADNTNVDREAFDRDGRNQASVGSTESVTLTAATTGCSSGSGGFHSRRDSSGRGRSSTGHSEAGVGGGQQAAVRSRAVVAEFNPFKKQDERELLNSRTHNRRRWTHVFPPGETEFHTMDTMPGPIWNSLCQPALLPLSIDFVPSPQEMMDDYTESNHDIMLGPGLTLDSVKPLLEEMVAQRIAQDFQLVEQVGPGMGSIQRMAYDSLARRGRGMAENQHPTVQDGLVHILSMGHRLQTLSFDKGVGTVKVRKFTLKKGSAGDSAYDYAYSLWLPITGNVQTVQQKFFKYPQPEYPFNYVDNLISGDYTELKDAIKCRRLLFNIVPPKTTTREEQEAYVTALGRLADHLNKKRKTDLDSDAETSAPVSFQLGRRFLETSTDGLGAGATKMYLVPRRRSVRMDMTVRVASGGDDARGFGKGKDFEDGKDGDKGAEKGVKTDEAQPHEEWLDVVHDEVVGMEQVLQLDVRWLLCSAAKVEEYVKELHSCAQDLQLRLLQVPEYARATEIHLNPLLTHPYIRIPVCDAADEAAILSSVQKHLLDTREYVRCSDVCTDWKSFGLQIPRKMDLGGIVHGNPEPSRRVYMHTSGAAFVRIAPSGLVFLENLHWCDTGEASEQDGGAVECLREQLLDNLHRVVTATHLARCVVNSAISEAVDAALTNPRASKANTAASPF